ncbi:hypothetical protein GCM10010924_58860 [Rhizobium wenxiniae]|nr:hypothetical protein GCM10010924_58860 [Rhizobium wenxiniae]
MSCAPVAPMPCRKMIKDLSGKWLSLSGVEQTEGARPVMGSDLVHPDGRDHAK